MLIIGLRRSRAFLPLFINLKLGLNEFCPLSFFFKNVPSALAESGVSEN